MPHVLIVDDELGIRSLLSEILSDEGYAVSTAQDGAEAQSLVRSEHFDLILLDIWMPDTDGVTLLKEWVANKVIHCPVIMMSGHATIETAMESTRHGAMDFLEKPISLKRLLQTCERVLQDWKEQGRESFEALAPGQTGGISQKRLFHRSPAQGCFLLEESATAARRPVNEGEPKHLPIIEVRPLGLVLDFNRSFRDMRDDFERAYLTRMLVACNGSVAMLAQHAQVERTHLYRKLKALGIDTEEYTKQEVQSDALPVYGLPSKADYLQH
mgnify:CR=1 FL=1